MKKIHYTAHLEAKLKLREIPYNLPQQIYETAKERYFDRETKLLVAVKSIEYKNKIREFALIYRETTSEVIFITIHPLKFTQKLNRVESKRWQKYEKI